MAWYMAVLVRGAHVGGVLDDERMGDMLYLLVEAEDAEDAHARALELGRAASDSYEDDDGSTVTLSVIGMADLAEIGDESPDHGVEVYSQMVPTAPSEMVVAKEELTVFEQTDEADETV
jgi:hypothetical protein